MSSFAGWRFGILPIILVASAANAQVTFDGCVDSRGEPVASIRSAVNNVAVADIENGRPVIYYNTGVLSQFSEVTRLFWYAHECAHHVLGHHVRNNPLTREKEADCWAVSTLRSQGLLTDAGLSTVESEIARLGGDGWVYLPGPQRAMVLQACGTAATAAGERGRESGAFCEGLERVMDSAEGERIASLATRARNIQEAVEDEYFGQPARIKLSGARECVISSDEAYECEFGPEEMSRTKSRELYDKLVEQVDACLRGPDEEWSREQTKLDGDWYSDYERGRRGIQLQISHMDMDEDGWVVGLTVNE